MTRSKETCCDHCCPLLFHQAGSLCRCSASPPPGCGSLSLSGPWSCRTTRRPLLVSLVLSSAASPSESADASLDDWDGPLSPCSPPLLGDNVSTSRQVQIHQLLNSTDVATARLVHSLPSGAPRLSLAQLSRLLHPIPPGGDSCCCLLSLSAGVRGGGCIHCHRRTRPSTSRWSPSDVPRRVRPGTNLFPPGCSLRPGGC